MNDENTHKGITLRKIFEAGGSNTAKGRKTILDEGIQFI